jgi:signal transduction histidine kinase
MTKRIAIAMLATVWLILIAGSVTAYLTIRSVVLANMDETIVARAAPDIQADRFIAKNQIGQTVEGSAYRDGDEYKPQLLSAKFVTLDDGTRVRNVTVRTFKKQSDGTMEPVTAISSDSAAPFDRLMNRLAMALAIVGTAGGIIAAFVAHAVARIALRPLRSTAQTIGEIDERNLSRRIDAAKLAPELVPVAEKLNEMLARLESSFDNRKRFLADASHELRTPVAAMVTTLEVSLRRLRDADSYRETMQTCLADARLLRTLVEGLMSQARSEIGAFKEDAAPTDVTKLLRESIGILSALADERKVSLVDSIDEGMRAELQPGRLKQVVMGLMENAIDHNRPGGSVELSATLRDRQLVVSVKDTGPGIAAEHLPRIFEPFYRASPSREAGGHMGLGLYLLKTHVDAMNGQCRVTSEIGKGSVFQVTVPVQTLLESPLAPVLASQK